MRRTVGTPPTSLGALLSNLSGLRSGCLYILTFSLLISLALNLALGVTSAAAAAREYTGEIHDVVLYSDVLHEEREITIRLPLDYRAQNPVRYPVLYVLDGDVQTSHTTGTVSYLYDYGQLPDLIVVMIHNTERTRDMTRIPEERFAADFPNAGGYLNYLAFIETELIPHIESHYRSNTFRLIAGHSLGGLFVMETLMEKPDLFQAHFAFSPSLWWNPEEFFPRMETLFAERNNLQSFLYMNLGTEGPSMRPGFERIQALLESSAPEGLNWHAKLYPDEVHVTTPVFGTHEALRTLFKDWAVNAGDIKSKEDLVTAYRERSERLGYEMTPDERSVNRIANNIHQFREEPALAREILQISLDLYPNSPHPRATMARFYLREEKLTEALNWINAALAMVEPSYRHYPDLMEIKQDILAAM